MTVLEEEEKEEEVAVRKFNVMEEHVFEGWGGFWRSG